MPETIIDTENISQEEQVSLVSPPDNQSDVVERQNHTDFRLEHKSHRATKIDCGFNHAALSSEGKLFLWGKFCSIVENDS